MNQPHSAPADLADDAHEAPHGDDESAGDFDPSVLHDARDQALAAMDVAREWIVANPAKALGVAVGAGFLLGRVMRR
ncbi:MAG: hypothetical protein ACE37F_38155 [Nannocystaceae bacterium]|nr:hypothetical protein [bacterium]